MQKQMWREMLRLKTRLKLTLQASGLAGWKTAAGRVTGARQWTVRAGAGCLAAVLLMAGVAHGQASTSSSTDQAAAQPATPRPLALNKIGPAAPPSYDNRYEIFGGLNFMNFQGGQALPSRMNLGGGELLGTYWLTKKLGGFGRLSYRCGNDAGVLECVRE